MGRVQLRWALRIVPEAEGVAWLDAQFRRCKRRELAFLQERGCHEAQGYLFGRPLPTEEFVPWLRARSQGDTIK